MTRQDPVSFLARWAAEHVSSLQPAERKSDMREEARACVQAAEDAGLTVEEIKRAANGDLETWLLNNVYDRGAVDGRTGP